MSTRQTQVDLVESHRKYLDWQRNPGRQQKRYGRHMAGRGDKSRYGFGCVCIGLYFQRGVGFPVEPHGFGHHACQIDSRKESSPLCIV